MSKAKLDELEKEFSSTWAVTPDYIKVLYLHEITRIRENSYRRNRLMEELGQLKEVFKIQSEKFKKSIPNFMKWFFGSVILIGIIDLLDFLEKETMRNLSLLPFVVVVIYLISNLYEFIEMKSNDVKISNLENLIVNSKEIRFPVRISGSLSEDIGSEYGITFTSKENQVKYEEMKLALLSDLLNDYHR